MEVACLLLVGVSDSVENVEDVVDEGVGGESAVSDDADDGPVITSVFSYVDDDDDVPVITSVYSCA